MTGLIVGAEYTTQRTLSHVPAMFMSCVKTIAIIHVMFVNPFPTNAVETAQIHCWWYEEIIRIDPAQKDSDLPCMYITIVNTVSQRVCSLLMLFIRLR